MKLGHKISAISIVATFTVALIIGSVWSSIMHKSYKEVQDEVSDQSIENFKNKYIDEKGKLTYLLEDWAKWDDTYYYVEDKNVAYEIANLPVDTFIDSTLDFILIKDNEDFPVYYGEFDSNEIAVDNTEDDFLLALLRTEEGDGLILVDDRLILFGNRKILDSREEKIPNGELVFAKYLDENDFKKFAEELNLELESADVVGRDERIKLDEYMETDRLRKEVVRIPIVNPEKDLAITIVLEEKILALGEKSINDGLFVLVLVLFIFTVTVNSLLKRILAKRIINMNRQIGKIDKESVELARIRESGNDELGELANQINEMLQKIEKYNNKLIELAYFDEMTGVLNRGVGIQKVEDYLEKNTELSIVFIDIDNLKHVNDYFGHKYGDELIKTVIDFLKMRSDEEDLIIRFGGDEFVLALLGQTYNQAERIMNVLDDDIRNFNQKSDKDFYIGFSYGIEEYRVGESFENLVDRADKAMYRNKMKKGNYEKR